ncbi:hypothetical protein DF3PB_140018 [uncultured Defluviicoccus sp.]|uniref:Uncharacterized protein n=1 Tax=metagenome TaxID=256318 RepID=A0A380T947_9ZZZZ|nr:hypothetical protein DF3PB_140018 [uncultured Defluviicoccus sp.]
MLRTSPTSRRTPRSRVPSIGCTTGRQRRLAGAGGRSPRIVTCRLNGSAVNRYMPGKQRFTRSFDWASFLEERPAIVPAFRHDIVASLYRTRKETLSDEISKERQR